MQIDEATLYRYIGRQLKQQRQRRNWTQQQLADAMDMLRTSIANIETGRQKTPLHILYRLCLVLNLEVSVLLPRVAEVTRVEVDHSQSQAPLATEFLKQLLDE